MNRAEEYKRRLAEKRAREVGHKATAEIALPSGAVWLCCRPPLETWMTGGKIPQSLLQYIVKKGEGVKVSSLTPEEHLAAMMFMRDAITYAVVEPKLRTQDVGGRWVPLPGDTPADAADYFNAADIDPEDFEFLMGWIMKNCPGVPVKTKGGEVQIDDLAQFRQKRTHGRPFSLEPNGGEVRDEAERVAGVG